MTRDDFLAEVHALADQLGAELWAAIERQTDRAKAAALEAVKGQFRAQIVGDATPSSPPATEQAARRRAPRRCSKCDELGHDVRKCPRAIVVATGAPDQVDRDDAEQPVVAAEPDAVEGAADPADHEDLDDEDDPCEAPSPPPYTLRPLRPDRSRSPGAAREDLTCARRPSIACCARPTRAATCRRPAGRPRATGARSTPICRWSPC